MAVISNMGTNNPYNGIYNMEDDIYPEIISEFGVIVDPIIKLILLIIKVRANE